MTEWKQRRLKGIGKSDFKPANQRIDRWERKGMPTGGPAAQLNGLPIVEIPGRAQQVNKEPPTKKVKRPCYESLSTTQRNKRAKELWNHQHACRTCGTLRRLEIHIDDDGGDLFLCGRCHEGVHRQMELHPEASSQAVIQAYARLRAAKTASAG